MKSETKEIEKSFSKGMIDWKIENWQGDVFPKVRKAYETYQKNRRKSLSNGETEEHQKNIFRDFLKDAFSLDVNTLDKIDSVLCDEDGHVKVIIEYKRGQNQGEMVQRDDFNRKAFHEALSYFYQIKNREGKDEYGINYLLITDGELLYFFPVSKISELVNMKSVKNILENHINKTSDLVRNKPDLYDALKKTLRGIDFTLIADVIDFTHDGDEQFLMTLSKVFSPYFLFKKPLGNDANELDQGFYSELLYTLGLKEDKGKLVPNNVEGSFLNLILHTIKVKKKFVGQDAFQIAMSLMIVWLNRLLFLKILESHLVIFSGKRFQRFLNPSKIENTQHISTLFFAVLAQHRVERMPSIKQIFPDIPYLNSSLFEETTWEKELSIDQIAMTGEIDLLSKSVIHQNQSKKKRYNFLEYFLTFINCYRFNIDEESTINSTVISASVLGLIFEKINNYADGAHFTPSSITMYMAQESCERLVLDRVNQAFNKQFASYAEMISKVKRFTEEEEIAKLRSIVDKLTILDPAVGSGHYLVSCLNRLMAIKADLYLLDGMKITVENDELILKDHLGHSYRYERNERGDIGSESQKMQEMLFNEKRKIIENQLYGVDINPNSVNICRLRLWIELLKSTYYTDDAYIDCEILPNLEFKVTCADSLVPLARVKGQMLFGSEEEEKLLKRLQTDLRDYFGASVDKETKRAAIDQTFVDIKKQSDFGEEALQQLQGFDPFNITVSNAFFDASLMFGRKQFDLVIGNPPYVSNKAIQEQKMKQYEALYHVRDDLYYYFYLRGFKFLKEKGVFAYITSNTFLTLQTKIGLRQFLQEKHLLEIRLVKNVFKKAAVEPVMVFAMNENKEQYTLKYVDNRKDEILSEKQAVVVDINLYKQAPHHVFFTPNDENLSLAKRYFGKIKQLFDDYWPMIKTSRDIEKNKQSLEQYRAQLKAGDITLLGVVTDGGVGLQTGNNGYYIGVRADSKDAQRVARQRKEKIAKFNKEYGTDYEIDDLSEDQIRQLFHDLKSKHGRDVFGQGFLYQIVSLEEIADVASLSQEEKENGIASREKATFVPYDKGDKEGNRWYMPTVYVINWSKENVTYLKGDPKARYQGYLFYFREGFSWNNVLNPNASYIKTRYKGSSINDVASMTLYSISSQLSIKYLILLLNSYTMFYYLRTIINNTVNLQINDMRQLPIIVPTPTQLAQAEQLFDQAKAVKQLEIQQALPPVEAQKQLLAIEKQVDDFVAQLYGMEQK